MILIKEKSTDTVKQLLVMVKSILYEGTIALGTGVDFGKVQIGRKFGKLAFKSW